MIPHIARSFVPRAGAGTRPPLLVAHLALLLVPLLPGPPLVAQDVRREMLPLDGVEAPVEILRDRWGIAHIYAENEHDLFFAQGWSAARDRLFQLEIWRRQATGTVAEILGPRAVRRDIGSRLFRYRGDLEEELDHYHPRGAEIIRAFVEGVNAYVRRTREDPSLLPLEFEILGIRPGEWTPEVVVSRHQGLLGNMPYELDYGRAVAVLGPETVERVMNFHPGDPGVALDSAVDGRLLFDDILGLYEAFHSPVDFRPEDVRPEYRPGGGDDAGEPADEPGGDGGRRPVDARLRDIGSNNWVVRGERTLDGHPYMANDPHRTLQAPSLRYMVHLVAPGWNVIGAGEPAIPGVSIGHNEHGAWGLTVFETDGEDLYVYETDPADHDRYRYRDGWERMRVRVDTIRVEGAEPVVAELRYTRHGPVVYRDTANAVAYAVRAAWLEPGGAPYLASLRMDQARTWEEFRDACRYSHIPGENMVWADTAGNIGWQAVGIAPRRPSWSGLVPVPGDGRYEWDGYLPIEDKPHVLNPPAGYWATANENLVPRGYPHTDAMAFEWADPFRAARIHEVLASGRRLSMADMMRLQTDYLSIPARTLVPLLEAVETPHPQAGTARRRLLAWDHVLAPESMEAAVYVAWERRLLDGLLDRAGPPAARDYLGPLSMERAIDWLLAPPAWLFAEDGSGDPVAGRDAFVFGTFMDAVLELVDRLGPNPEEWRYGGEAYKHVLIRHPLSGAVDAETRERLEVGPAPRGGNGFTVNNTAMGDNQTAGASFRIIADVGDWDASVAISAPGQGGDPAGRHYRDLFPLWATDRYFPLFYSRARVQEAAEERLQLVPAVAGPDP